MTTKPAKPRKKSRVGNKYRVLRASFGMNQVEFWEKVGVTQSGGSRYETGREVPKSVDTLVELIYGPNNKAIPLLAELRETTVEEMISNFPTEAAK
mgnify:CR=1